MYDTIRLFLPKERVSETNLLTQTPLYLSGITEHKQDERISISGQLRNCKVNISEQGISVKGSIAKYFLNDNFQTLTRSDTQRAFQMMADEIHLPMEQAVVRRVDFAQNFITKYIPETYYNSLGDCQHYSRMTYQQSIAYQNSLRYKTFYNKISEGKSRGVPIPEIWKGANVLRYEMRYTKRLPSQFNMPEVTASVLWNEIFYMGMVERWVQEYEAINKLTIFTPDIKKPMTAAQSQKILFAALVSQTGQNEVMEMVEQWHKQNLYSTNREYFRAKKDIKQMMKKLPEGQNELITELNKNVREVKMFYR